MNKRIRLQDIADRIIAQTTDIHVGTAYDADFIKAFATTYPAAWVVGQRLRPLDDGRGFTGVFRQNNRVEIVVRIVVQKVPSTDDVDARLEALQNAVSDALIGWKPTNASRSLGWDLAQDGPPHEGVVNADLIFATEVVYKKPA